MLLYVIVFSFSSCSATSRDKICPNTAVSPRLKHDLMPRGDASRLGRIIQVQPDTVATWLKDKDCIASRRRRLVEVRDEALVNKQIHYAPHVIAQ